MFDTEFAFEELPLTIGSAEFGMCSGTAFLEGEIGPHDYGFSVAHITLDGNRIGDYCDKRVVRISPKSDDPFCALLFERLSNAIETDRNASDHFYFALQDHLQNAA